MTRKIMLYVVIALLLIIAGAIITGQFDIHPLAGVIVALVIIALTAAVTRKKND